MDNIAQLGIKVDSTDIKSATNELGKLSNQSGKTEQKTQSLVSSVAKLAGSYIALSQAMDAGRYFLKTADAMTLVDSRLKLATNSAESFAKAQQELYNISQLTRTQLTSTVDLFERMTRSTRDYKLSQDELLGITQTINKAMIISGGTAESMNASIIQLGQALSADFKGVGQELASIREQTPRLYQALLDGTNKSSDAFRKLAEDGKLSTKIIIDALKSQGISVDAEFLKINKTVAQSQIQVSNAMGVLIKNFNDMTGLTEGLAEGFTTLSKNINSISSEDIQKYIDLTKTVGSLAASLGGAILVFSTYNKVAGIASTLSIAYAASLNTVNAAILLTAASTKILNAALKASPLGVVAGAIYLLSESFTDAKTRSDNLSVSVKTLANDLSVLDAKSRLVDVNKQLKEMDERLKTYSESQKLMGYKGAYDLIYKEKLQLEGVIKLSEEKNELIKKGEDELKKNATTTTEISDNLKNMLYPVQAIKNKYIEYRKELEKSGNATKENLEKLKQLEQSDLEALSKKLNKTEDLEKANKKLEETEKARSEIAQIGMNQYDKSISSIVEQTNNWLKAGVSENEVLTAKAKLLDELNSKNILENLQVELSYYEKKLQLQKDSLDKELESIGIQYAQTVLNIESSDKTIEQKQKLIALETELYDETVKRLKADNNAEFQDTIKSFQEDSLARQIELNNAIFDFGAGFKSSNNEIMEVSKSLAAMSDASLKSKRAENELNKKYTTEFTKYAGDVEKTKELEQQYTKDTALLNKQAINNQILGYANLSGAISGMFQQGSKEAATFQAAQTVLALVEGTRAILTAGTGDPYTAIPRMAAMAIMVKSLLGNIGVSLGMGGTSTTTGDSFSMQKANTGTGSVLGDTSKASESITKSLSILEDYAKPEFRLSQQMSKSLESIDSKIGGVTSLLLQNSATALGTNYTGGFDTGFKNNISLSSMTLDLINPINSIISKIPIIGDLNNILGGVINSALGALFGKTSVKRTLKDSGITFADSLLKDAITEFDGSVYQTISTKTTKKSLFGSSSSTKLKTYFTGLDDSISNQFSLVLKNLYDTVYQAGNALEIGSDSLNNSLNNFVVSIGKISLKDKTGPQIQELLTSVFGKIGDDLAKAVVPTVTPFQKVGEGLFTTLTRVASGMEQANYFTDRLGATFQKINFNEIINKQGDVGFEALYQSILRVEKGANFNNVLSTLKGTAEDLYSAYTSLDLIRDRLAFLGKGLDGLSISAITGAGGLEQLSDGISSFIENFYSSAEQQQLKVSELNQELNRTGITTIPTTIAGFKALVNGIDTTTESGQKLYGSLISLSDSFYDVYSSVEESRTSLISSLKDFVSSIKSTIQTDTTFKDFSSSFNNMIDAIRSGSGDLSDIGNATINTAQSYLDTVSRTAKSSAEIEFAKKIVANKFEGVINAKDITLGTINDTLKISFNEDSVIVKALNDVKNELVYLNQLNTRQTANSNKTLQLQRASIA